jgi:hypothetical protein
MASTTDHAVLVAALPPVGPPPPIPYNFQGFGSKTIGGQGGVVIKVTTLEDIDTEGSLRWAVNQKGPRIIQFKVWGILKLKEALDIREPFITIDGSFGQMVFPTLLLLLPFSSLSLLVSSFLCLGSSAHLSLIFKQPTYGVTIANWTINVRTQEVIIRYVRVRRGAASVLAKNKKEKRERPENSVGLDTINIVDSKNVVIDHVSASWSTDEIFSCVTSKGVTIQW